MKREVGWYSAKLRKDSGTEIVYYDGRACQRTGCRSRSPEEFYWISDKPIVPEEPPVTFEVGSYYLFEDSSEKVGFGRYRLATSNFTDHGWDQGVLEVPTSGSGYYVSAVKILAGPFTVDELIKLKPF